jgi:hypothetical protein
MTYPGFTAERSAGPTLGRYRGVHAARAHGLTPQTDDGDTAADVGCAVGCAIGSAIGGALGGIGAAITEAVAAALKKTPCKGGELLGKQARSECRSGYFHVIGTAFYRCPDGTMQTIEESDEKTLQRC